MNSRYLLSTPILMLMVLPIFSVGCADEASRCAATGELTSEQAEAFRHVKTIRLEVREHYDEAKKQSIPVVSELPRLLVEGAGFTIVGADAKQFDATLTVDLKGTASETTETPNGRRTVTANLAGTITLTAGAASCQRRLSTNSPGGVVADGKVDLTCSYQWSLQETNFLDPSLKILSDVFGISPSRPLTAALACDDFNFQSKIVERLARCGTDAVEPLLALLKKGDRGHRRGAVEALGLIGDRRAVGPLIAALDDRDLVGPASDALGRIRDRRAVGPLLRVMKGSAPKSDKWSAAKALAAIPDRSVIKALADGLAGDDHEFQELAAVALDQYLWAPYALNRAASDSGLDYESKRRFGRSLFGVHLPPSEKDLKPLLAEAAAQAEAVQEALAKEFAKALSDGGSARRIAFMFGALRPDSHFAWDRVQAKRAGQTAVAPLVAALKNDDPNVRCGAAAALGKIGDPAAVEPIIGLLKDKEPGVRERAAVALADLKDPRAVKPLIGALRQMPIPLEVKGYRCGNQPDPEWQPASRAAWALGKLQAKQAVEALIAALKQGDDDFGSYVAEALGRIGDPVAIGPLMEVMSGEAGPGDSARMAAGFALARLGKPAIGPLIAALKDENAAIQASSALEEIGEPAVEPLLAVFRSGPEKARSIAGLTLAKIKSPVAMQRLIEALKDKDKELRDAAIWALWGTMNPQVVMPLLAVMENPQEDDNIRNEALFALASVPDRRAIGPVTRILLYGDSETLVANAGWVLAKMPGQEPVEALLDCLKNNRDAMRRTSAAHGLGEIKHGRAVPALLAALKDEDADVRLNAVESLQSLRESRALALLRELSSKDPAEYVRKAAAAAVQKIEDAEESR